jgi:uncharacterized protein with FMN-binding domain
MKKATIIILTIATLGVLTVYVASREDDEQPVAQSSQVKARDRSTTASSYKDGTYTSDVAETLYGNVQISIVIVGGKISDVVFVQMPDKDDGRSRQLTAMSKPLLRATTLDKQSDQIDFVTGATSTSYGYQESLQSALDKAHQVSQSET